MKIVSNPDLVFDDDVMEALRVLQADGSTRRGHFHPLIGYDNLCALSIPGTSFKGRIILKHHGHNVYEPVLTDRGHKYPPELLRQLDGLGFRDYLKPLFEVKDASEAEVAASMAQTMPAYRLRGRIGAYR